GLDWPKTKATDDWSRQRQQQELTRMLDALKDANINIVLFQARTRGVVAYGSAIESYDEVWSGRRGESPGYDPLAFAVEECHKRGMECHAWVVAIPPARGYRDPNDPYTAQYVAAICEEITRNYDIDGISLDYIRYKDGANKGVPHAQACGNITRIVREVNERVKGLKPWVKLSCSPIGKYRETVNLHSKYTAFERGQNVEQWTYEGLMDMVFPMAYFSGKDFDPFIPQWQQIANGKLMAPGLGIYFMDPREGRRTLEVTAEQMNLLRYNAGMGFAFFRAAHLISNIKGIYDFTKRFCPYPALVPSIDSSRPKPKTPTGVKVQRGSTSTRISWTPQSGCLINIYASRQWPVDINNAANLIAVRVRGSFIDIPIGEKMHYAITATDRYGNESNEISTAKEKPRTAFPDRSRNSQSDSGHR
ncbi:MAG: family 10 glycosylhydrolase, partial [Bacteroidaceae bacterium]|nr:family 10 glycosylhydrolase [Bacteroidaceae bacterium]